MFPPGTWAFANPAKRNSTAVMHAALSMRRFSLPGIHPNPNVTIKFWVYAEEIQFKLNRLTEKYPLGQVRSARRFRWRCGSRSELHSSNGCACNSPERARSE